MSRTTLQRPPRTEATRIARHLRPAATAMGAWVSTQALFRIDAATLLRPAVIVVAGEPPYDGVVTGGALLVVELETRLGQRWQSVDVAEVWFPSGDEVTVRTQGSSRTVPATASLAVTGHPTLSLPAHLVARPAGEGVVIALHG